MKRKFADLHLRLNIRDTSAISRIANQAKKMDYHLISIPTTPEHKTETAEAKKISQETKLDLATRVDLRPRTKNELLQQLRRLRRKFEIICVYCETKEVARQAAKDRRVDLLNFPLLDFRKRFFDRPEAELATNSLAALEIDTKPLLVLNGPPRVRLLSNLRREVGIAKNYHVPIVISSGANSEIDLRRPREIAAVASLFGMDEVSALEAISTIPMAMLNRNREKLDPGFVAPGIHIVKRGN